MYGISQRRFEQKTIYNYTRNHLLEWVPKLPSYQAFIEWYYGLRDPIKNCVNDKS